MDFCSVINGSRSLKLKLDYYIILCPQKLAIIFFYCPSCVISSNTCCHCCSLLELLARFHIQVTYSLNYNCLKKT